MQKARLSKQITKKDCMANQPKKPDFSKKPKFNSLWIIAVVILGFLAITFFDSDMMGQKKISSSEFQTYLKDNEVSKVVVVNRRIAKVFLTTEAKRLEKHKQTNGDSFLSSPSSNVNKPDYQFEIGDLQNFENSIREAKSTKDINTTIEFDSESNVLGDLLISLLPFALIIGVWIFIMRRMGGSGGGGPGGQIFNIGKSKAKLFDKDTDVKTSFANVAGLEGAKEEVQEIVDFLKNPEKYTSLGGKIPKGALLVGPPGTGKTLLAKAVAGEAKVPFFSLSGSDFVEMFVGVGASRVRDLFKQAKEKSPAIIFIDEIDAIGRARGKSNMSGSNDERENTLNVKYMLTYLTLPKEVKFSKYT